MGKLVFQKSYIREAFEYKSISANANEKAEALFKFGSRTSFDSFWYLYLASFVNEISTWDSNNKIFDEEATELKLEDDIKYKAYYFDDLTLTYSSVGYLPEKVNDFFERRSVPVDFAKKVFAAYMVLLGSNYIQHKFYINGVTVEEKLEAIKSFEKLFAFLKRVAPDNIMLKLFDICMDAVSVNKDNMLSFNVEQIIEFFNDNFEVDLRRCNFKDVEFLQRMEGLDILALLENAEELYPEDLEYFVSELETSGNYDDHYIKKCKQKIEHLTSSHVSHHQINNSANNNPMFVSVDDISPYANAGLTETEIKNNNLDKFFTDVVLARKVTGKPWAVEFNSVVKKFKELNTSIIKENATFFKPKELNALLKDYDMGEEFLEQYFSILDPVVIACHQHFSEKFFMNHFNDLNYNNVLKKGVNDWRLKENRSKQLDVFLRLKGVNI